MRKQFKVFHANNPKFGFGDPIFNDQNYIHVATVECETIDEAFEITNHIWHDWTNNQEVIWCSKQTIGSEKALRSTSVGDVIQDMETCEHYRCMMAGWKRI